MRITLTAGVAALLMLFACGSDSSEETTADATTGAESNGGEKAGKGGASPQPGAAGASGTRASSAGKGASGTGGSSAGKGASGAGASGGAGASSAGASGATAGASGATAGASAAGATAGASGASAGAGGDASSAKCDPSCPDGQRCELVQVTCIRAPCPPLPMCVAATSCDPAKILCKRAAPQCPEFQVPSVEGSCYGPCVPVDSCVCSNASQCPNHDSFTCHMSAGRCGPYV
jgi:hypothetical protein